MGPVSLGLSELVLETCLSAAPHCPELALSCHASSLVFRLAAGCSSGRAVKWPCGQTGVIAFLLCRNEN